MHCWGGGAAQTASSGMADDGRVTKINHFYNGIEPEELAAVKLVPGQATAQQSGQPSRRQLVDVQHIDRRRAGELESHGPVIPGPVITDFPEISLRRHCPGSARPAWTNGPGGHRASRAFAVARRNHCCATAPLRPLVSRPISKPAEAVRPGRSGQRQTAPPECTRSIRSG